MLPYLKGALQRDMPVLVEALAADFKEKAVGALNAPECPTAQHVMRISKGTYNSFICNRCRAGKSGERWFCGNCRDDYCLECEPRRDKKLNKLEELEAQISRHFDALSTDLETLEKMSWY